jgi:hypothetical protein
MKVIHDKWFAALSGELIQSEPSAAAAPPRAARLPRESAAIHRSRREAVTT